MAFDQWGAVIGVGGTLLGGLVGIISSELNANNTHKQSEASWLREKRFDVYSDVVKDAQLRREMLHEEAGMEDLGIGGGAISRDVLPWSVLGSVTARLHLVGEEEVKRAWGKYADEVGNLYWEPRINGVEHSSENVIAAVDELLKVTRLKLSQL